MRDYIIKRLLQIIPTVLAITLVVFAMMQAIPGDPIITLLGDAYDEEDAQILREEYGLNKPIIVQYGIWLGKFIQGDWGEAIISGRSVLQDVLIRLPVTAELIVMAMVVALIIAIPAGIIAAIRQNTWGDYTAMSTAMVGISIPDFFLGILLLLIFSFALNGLLPSSGWVYLPGTCPSIVCESSVGGNLKHVIMPAIALGVGRAAILTRLLRASMLEIVRMEYVTTARAKGLAEKFVVLKHALKTHGDHHGSASRLSDRWRHCGGDLVRYPWFGHLRHQRHHRARVSAGPRLYPARGYLLCHSQFFGRSRVRVPRSAHPL
jgi:peptide/nickel transport system permease protein